MKKKPEPLELNANIIKHITRYPNITPKKVAERFGITLTYARQHIDYTKQEIKVDINNTLPQEVVQEFVDYDAKVETNLDLLYKKGNAKNNKYNYKFPVNNEQHINGILTEHLLEILAKSSFMLFDCLKGTKENESTQESAIKLKKAELLIELRKQTLDILKN